MMTHAEAEKLIAITNEVITKHQTESQISPTWIATAVMQKIDPDRISPPLVYIGCHLEIRQLARGILGKRFDKESEDNADPIDQHEMFPGLQKRYPLPRSSRDAEPVYQRLEDLTRIDVIFNVNRLRREAVAKNDHADRLEAYCYEFFPPLPA